jgi:hypothetical protein
MYFDRFLTDRIFILCFTSMQVAATDTGLKNRSVAVPSSVSQKRTGQANKNDPTSTTKRSRFSD